MAFPVSLLMLWLVYAHGEVCLLGSDSLGIQLLFVVVIISLVLIRKSTPHLCAAPRFASHNIPALYLD